MQASYEIQITQQDIDEAAEKRSSKDRHWDVCAECPIAVAASRALDRPCEAAGNTVDTRPDGEYLEFALPDEAQSFMRAFDGQDATAVTPITFVIVQKFNGNVAQ